MYFANCHLPDRNQCRLHFLATDTNISKKACRGNVANGRRRWAIQLQGERKMIKKTISIAALAAVTLISGCATQIHNKDALSRPNNRFAIVSFGGLTSGLGMTEAEDLKMIAGLDEVVYKELSQSKRFKLVPPATVKASRSYALIKSEPTDGMYTVKVAPGYKRFDPKNESAVLKKLMTELNLTGVIQVNAYYNKEEKTAFVSGLLPIPGIRGGVANGHINYTIVAYDKNLEVIWQDLVEATTKDSTIVIMGIANVGKLYPQLVDITQEASRMTLKNLNEKVGGKI
jgi:hypothetical protein